MNNNKIIAEYCALTLPVEVVNVLSDVKTTYNFLDNKNLYYHSFQHVENVVNRVWYLYNVENYGGLLEYDELLKILYAACFHDIGYLYNSEPAIHEENSVEYLKDNYSSFKLPEEWMEDISNYIMATKITYEPKTIGEKLIRDADILHWAMNFMDLTESTADLVKELKFSGDYEYFLEQCINRFISKYDFEGLGAEKYNTLKAKNIVYMEETIKYINFEPSLFDDKVYDFKDSEYVHKRRDEIKELNNAKKYLKIADSISALSKANRRKVGAIIVDKKGIIVGTGYNGTPRGTDNNCETENNITKDVVIHAEQNAIFNSNRLDLDGYTVYCTTEPCLRCSASLVQKGIKKVYYSEEYSTHDGINFLKESGVEVFQVEIDRDN